jgi:hypothetical protein
LKRVRANESNVKNHMISLYFDRNDKLVSAERLGYARSKSYKVLEGVQIVETILE